MSGDTTTANARADAPGSSVIELTSGALCRMVQGRLVGADDAVIRGVSGIDEAGPTDLTFIRSARHAPRWTTSGAGVALVTEGAEPEAGPGDGRAFIITPDADMALQRVLEQMTPSGPPRSAGAHVSAIVDTNAQVAATASIGPGSVVEAGAVIEDGVTIAAQCYVGVGARIGAGSTLHPQARVLERCVLGPRCVLSPGATVGSVGFGFLPTPAGHTRVPHLAAVHLGAEVEIGAGSCVDRGKFTDTVIGDGTKIDNLVQIGHNCRIGKACIICGCSAVGGSTTIGDGVVIAGAASIADNVTIHDGAVVAARSGVMRDIPAGERWAGCPAVPAKTWLEQSAALAQLRRHMTDARRALAKLGAPLGVQAGATRDGSAGRGKAR